MTEELVNKNLVVTKLVAQLNKLLDGNWFLSIKLIVVTMGDWWF